MPDSTISTDPIDTIPRPQVVRDRLGRALREVDVLRRLLRVAEHVHDHRELSQETHHAAAR